MFAKLEAVYPSTGEELSFEELRAQSRGWFEKDWAPRIKVKEIRGETQTIKTNLESPTGPRLRRKVSAEPTMTLHTRAATDDILDIFNQPLRNIDVMAGPESEAETDYESDDDCTSAGESTCTGRMSNPDSIAPDSVSPWSDFTTSKHVPAIRQSHVQQEHDDHCPIADSNPDVCSKGLSESPTNQDCLASDDPSIDQDRLANDNTSPNQDDCLPTDIPLSTRDCNPKYMPIPPNDYEPPNKYCRAESAAQNRLPFMTPIIEKTETSLPTYSTKPQKTPCRPCRNDDSSPFQEIVNEARPPKVSKFKIKPPPPIGLIQDLQCNPVDPSIRNVILEHVLPSLRVSSGFHDLRTTKCNMAPEIRKFMRFISKPKSERTVPVMPAPMLRFPPASYSIQRELGKGAYAPVYLAEDEAGNTVAIKCEDPPTMWEFYLITVLHQRLQSYETSRLLRARSMFLYADEGYLVEDYLPNGTLLEWINAAKGSSQTGLDENVAMFFTIEAIRVVEALHSVDVLHGDLKADNCLVRWSEESDWDQQYHADGSYGWADRGLCLIDFGRSIDLRHFSPTTQFIADWKTSKQDCIEMRELRPWKHQIDYFGLAGIVHSLLFGKYIEDIVLDERRCSSGEAPVLGNKRKRYGVRENLKRYWQIELWNALFDLLLNPLCYAEAGEQSVSACLGRIRTQMECWLEGEGCRKNGGLRSALGKLEDKMREKRR